MPSLGWWFLAALMRHVQRYESDNCSRSGFVAVFLAFAAAAVSVGIVQPSLAVYAWCYTRFAEPIL
jgi:hypothetical protein